MCVYIDEAREVITEQSSSTLIVLAYKDVLSICEKLKRASKDWFTLGLAFGVNYSDLEDIEDQYASNKRRLVEMVFKRIEVTDPEYPMTWPYICECLRNPIVERNDVAEEIEGNVPTSVTIVLSFHLFWTDINIPYRGYIYFEDINVRGFRGLDMNREHL